MPTTIDLTNMQRFDYHALKSIQRAIQTSGFVPETAEFKETIIDIDGAVFDLTFGMDFTKENSNQNTDAGVLYHYEVFRNRELVGHNGDYEDMKEALSDFTDGFYDNRLVEPLPLTIEDLMGENLDEVI